MKRYLILCFSLIVPVVHGKECYITQGHMDKDAPLAIETASKLNKSITEEASQTVAAYGLGISLIRKDKAAEVCFFDVDGVLKYQAVSKAASFKGPLREVPGKVSKLKK